jgi:hypothetical protein
MTSGYLSREAVNDLLAVKEGEKDYLRQEIQRLQNEVETLKQRLQAK